MKRTKKFSPETSIIAAKAAGAPQTVVCLTKPSKVGTPPKTPIMRAQAIFYDDNYANFVGNNPRGKVPAIRTVHCLVPLTTTQLREAAAMRDAVSEAAPTLFWFFDFDETISLENGLEVKSTATWDVLLSELFGDEERQEALRSLLRPLLEAQLCYVLTANTGYAVIARILNALLARGGEPPSRAFACDETVKFTPAGTKIRAIWSIVGARGFSLVSTFG